MERLLARDSHSAYRIATPDQPTPATARAATTLQTAIQAVTGCRLPIVPEAEAASAPALLVGPCARAAAIVPPQDVAALAEDGFWIKTAGPDIALQGQNERGLLYGVHAFLERYLGVQVLAWDCTIAPSQPHLAVPDIDWAYAPPFMYREILYYNAFDTDTAVAHRLNGPFATLGAEAGGQWVIYPYVHSFSRLVPPAIYGEAHPEYYSLINGRRVPGEMDTQLCLANPDVARIATETVLGWVDAYPHVNVFDVSQNDGGGPCECAACRAIVDEEGSQHGPILRLVNAVADAVAAHKPGVWIETLAYHYSTAPPQITRPRDNVIIRLCHRGDYFQGFAARPMGEDFAGHVRAWTAQCRRVFIWHYATNFGHYLAPNQNLVGLARDLAFYGAHGVNGVMVQANYQSPGGELAELRQYLAARLLWDPTAGPSALRETFCRGYYGAAAEAVLAFLALMDEAADAGAGEMKLIGYANWAPCETVPRGLVDQGEALLAGAEAAETSPEVRNRIAKLRLPLWYMKLKYPRQYGLNRDDARPLLDRFEAVATANGILHVREVIVRDDPTGGMLSFKALEPGFRRHETLTPWIAQMRRRYGPPEPGVVYDLYAHMDDAHCEQCLVWRADTVWMDGVRVPSIFHHPPDPAGGDAVYRVAGDGANPSARCVGDATYRITLPHEPAELVFSTAFTAPTADGVRFAILIDGAEVWAHTQRTEPPEAHRIPLAPYAAQTVALTLRVDALETIAHDWAQWVDPKIRRTP